MPEFFDSTIVCDTGPIIGLSRAGLSHLLSPLFAQVLLPEAVVVELRAKHAGDAAQIEQAIALARVVPLAQPPEPLLLADPRSPPRPGGHDRRRLLPRPATPGRVSRPGG